MTEVISVINVRLKPETKAYLIQQAGFADRTLSEFVRNMIEAEIEKRKVAENTARTNNIL